MTTNAQAALQAAATWLSTDRESQDEQVTLFADKFKVWLDEQDEADRETRRKKPVPKGAGNTDDVASTRLMEPTLIVRETPNDHYRRDARVLPPHVQDAAF